MRAHLIRWSRGAAWLAGLGALAALCGCQPLPHPFADDRPPAALIAVPDSFDISVGSFEGEPQPVAAKLPAAVAHELLKHNIPASDATTSKTSYQLDGRIEQHPDRPGDTLVTVFWRLRDPKGKIVNERRDQLAAPTRDWSTGGDGAPVTQLAAAGAAGLAALMGDETPKEAAGGGRVRVALRKIAGAPGDGNTSLASSLNALLQHQDVELVDPARGKPDLAVDADITVDPAKDGKQHVKIVWHVARAAGGELGQVAQENDVPRGRLDGPWGDVAYSVAMAAQPGIMQIVDRSATAQKRAAAAAAPEAVPGVGTPALPTTTLQTPPVAGNIDSPEVNLPPVNVGAPDAPVRIPYRGVPIPR